MTAAYRLVATSIVAVTMLASPTRGRAQSAPCGPADFTPFYDCLRESTIVTLKQQITKIEAGARLANNRAIERTTTQAKTSARSIDVPARAPSLSTANATTATELAQAAISTSVAGADAGVTLSPLALMGYPDNAVQIPLTFAALKDGVTRLQFGVTAQQREDPIIKLRGCTVDDGAMRKAIDDARGGYAKVCQVVGELQLAAPAADQKTRRDGFLAQLHAACGQPSNPTTASPLTVGEGAEWIISDLRNLKDSYNASVPAIAAAARTRDEIQGVLLLSIGALAAYKEIAPDGCDSQSKKVLGNAAVQSAWNVTRRRAGLSMRGDLFRRQTGFNPDHMTPLDDGRLKDGEVRFELSYAKRSIELVGGIGVGAARPTVVDDLTWYLSPSLSFAWTMASLSGSPLYDKDDEINVVDGVLPPRLVVGVDAQLQYAWHPPPIQVVNIQKVAITAFVDFRFTDKLTVRIGAPITADLAIRPPKGTPVKEDRQWSFPAFVATVIKL